ncbi:glycosyltransferase [Chelativorans sp. ZYF759]|uniref:glycosyltransferase family 2 protein n=1 Tax=Chelativorans sp. ZYF759 TaxID=2692213 RepID=UPI00145D70F1|nr:glycosyltransferase [Chelativorans sp. ZYF759]NMG37687.1 glycosyltransferase [Chelativorans sp. ZYF759]
MTETGTSTHTIGLRSPGLEPEAIECVVVVPTFRRPDHLIATLRSILGQETARSFAVIVVENEAEQREGLAAAGPFFETGEAQGLCIVAHERGNCCAYNAGWETALSVFPRFRYLLSIDDDELADIGWMENMCSAAEALGADIVGGPQVPVFDNPAHARWADHPVFSPPHQRTGRVEALYSSGNLLLTRQVLMAMGPPFLDLRFNFMGGGDSDFLSRARKKGFVLAWCAEGQVHETIPPRRLESDWIRSRSLRNGVISTLVERGYRADSPWGRMRVTGKSLALLAASPLRATARLVTKRWPASAIYPVYVAAGRVLAEFGYVNEQYRQPEKN